MKKWLDLLCLDLNPIIDYKNQTAQIYLSINPSISTYAHIIYIYIYKERERERERERRREREGERERNDKEKVKKNSYVSNESFIHFFLFCAQ